MSEAISQTAENAGVEMDLPLILKRRSENKGKLSLDDFPKLFVIVDEQKMMEVDMLQCFVTANLPKYRECLTFGKENKMT